MASSPAELVAQRPLLETKFHIPKRRGGIVPRSRLVERLARGLDSKLMLVSAPPGFGKTTVLAEWVAGGAPEERLVAWLSLDRGDNDPATFWTYVIRALQNVQPEVGKNELSLLQSSQPPPIEGLLTAVLNGIAAQQRAMVLVLDDLHVIETGVVHDGIEFMLDHLPPNMRLAIGSRVDPMLPLARLRARGELTEIRAADLRFTPAEAAEFLNGAMGLGLPAHHIAALESRTEGWIAALQLAALSMQGRDDVAGFIATFTGDDRYIVDYLVEEVLRRQPGHVRSFLLQTSILERLCAPLCDAVTGQTSGRAVLEALERGNLFMVPLDDKRRWYRYHHLFADVLRAHLADEQAEQIPMLHRRASEWYAADGQPDPAIRHALAANDLARAAALVELQAETVVRHHRPDRLLEWLKPIPGDLIRSMPVLSTYMAIALQGIGDLEESSARLDDAERWFSDERGSAGMAVADQQALGSLPSRIAVARGYIALALGDVAATVTAARRALEHLLPEEHHWQGTAAALLGVAHWATGDLTAAQPLHADGVAYFERAGDSGLAITSAYHDAELLKARGRLTEAGRRLDRSLQFALEHGGAALRGAANLHLGLSDLCCERDDPDGAAYHLRQAKELGIFPPRTPYRHLLARARLQQCLVDLGGAIELLDEAAPLYVRGAVPDFRPVVPWKVRMQVAAGRLDAAMDWVAQRGLSVDVDLDYLHEYEHMTLARVLIARGRTQGDTGLLHDVDRLLDRLREAAEAGGRTGAVLETYMLQAIIHLALDELPAALSHLQRALTLAEPEGYVRTFVDEGAAMRDLLRHATAEGVGGAYSRRLLSTFEKPAAIAPARAIVAPLAEPLTARETEVLRLVAAGMRNQEIADHLVISLSTVKRHIANAYGKLGASHRTEAVARANELSLL